MLFPYPYAAPGGCSDDGGNYTRFPRDTPGAHTAGHVYPFTKFLLVSILKLFSFFGVFSVIPYGMTLNFNFERDIKPRI